MSNSQNEVPFFGDEPSEQPAPVAGSITERALAASNQSRGIADYLDGLNPEQKDAVTSLDGPLLVLAGAGTGKTRVLTTRIAHILKEGRAWPSQILAVTFTNKAAKEMKTRIARYLGDTVEGMPWLGTFHSISAKILRRHAELVGLKSNFTILDTDDQIRLLKQLIRADGIDALGEIEPAGCILGFAQDGGVGIGSDLQCGHARGQDKESTQEIGVLTSFCCGVKEAASQSADGQGDHDPVFIAEPADRVTDKDGDSEVDHRYKKECTEEGELNQAGLKIGEFETVLQEGDQDVVHYGDEAPHKEQHRDGDERLGVIRLGGVVELPSWGSLLSHKIGRAHV